MSVSAIPKKARCVVGHTNQASHNPLRESYLPVSPRKSHAVPGAIAALESTLGSTSSCRSSTLSTQRAQGDDFNTSTSSRREHRQNVSRGPLAVTSSPRRCSETDSHREQRAALHAACEAAKLSGMRALLFDEKPASSTAQAPVVALPSILPNTRFSARKDPDTFPLTTASAGTSSHAAPQQRFESRRQEYCAGTIGARDAAAASSLAQKKAESARVLQQQQAQWTKDHDAAERQRDHDRIAAKTALHQQYVAGVQNH